MMQVRLLGCVMLGRLYEGQDCAAARTLEIVGERWSLLILRDALFKGCTRFSDFQRDLGVAPNILARRLEVFVAAGLMRAVPTSPNSAHHEYVLTEKGLEFKVVVVALTAWGDKWLGLGPAEFVHEDCGGIVRQHLRCTRCTADVGVGQVKATARSQSATQKSGPKPYAATRVRRRARK
jgi:DNA-binding HxlR family transcriptional regulator